MAEVVSVVLICFRTASTPKGGHDGMPVTEVTRWSCLAEARMASELLQPCDAAGRCTGDHVAVFTQRGRWRVVRLSPPSSPKENG